MTEDEALKRTAIANEQIAANQATHLEHDRQNRQIAMERSLRQSALSAAVALASIHKYETRGDVIEAAREFLAWLRETPRLN